MIGHLAYAVGSPCPTLVLDARYLPRDRDALLAALGDARRWMSDAGGDHVLKVALIEPSKHPLCDLDYRFIQALPEDHGKFDLLGSCGHSVLSAITSAAENGMVPRLVPGQRVRVNVLNNGDYLACEVDEVTKESTRFTMHFLQTPPRPVSAMLLDGSPVTTLEVDGTHVDVSLVSAGNPYVFVGSKGAGVETADELFADDSALFDRLSRIRVAAAAHLGMPADSVFPKVAVTIPGEDGKLVVRAISVPSWHPTLAMTGTACLGVAAGIEGSIPWQAAQEAGCGDNVISVVTPGGVVEVFAAMSIQDDQRHVAWITVGDKRVDFHGSFFIEPLAHFQFKETSECLSESAA
ncbi:PrpF domain-containing protein [Amycolatopsis albispora]|uniref:Proline racemase n=1 Tax=Amycolatopsis albispora TaxID=1804986 RepID=A0A344LH64_9PSEU|nr:PrpF domain-containing protein [Amycolatopsis albispora]AXB47388.1 hypothetical protein A4R43_37140 [Amycolatopsis albispora]